MGKLPYRQTLPAAFFGRSKPLAQRLTLGDFKTLSLNFFEPSSQQNIVRAIGRKLM